MFAALQKQNDKQMNDLFADSDRLSGTAVCGAMGIDERPAAKGLVKLARPCVALNRGSAVPFIPDPSCRI